MLSNSCLVLPAVVKQQQEDISRNHVPSFVLQEVTVSSHFYPDFGLCKCRKHCQDFREADVEVEERNFEMGDGESSEEEIPEEIIDFEDSEDGSSREECVGGVGGPRSSSRAGGNLSGNLS